MIGRIGSEYKDIISRSQVRVSIKSDNGRIMNLGPNVKDIEAKTGKTIFQREIKVTRDKVKTSVGERDINIYKQNFRD